MAEEQKSQEEREEKQKPVGFIGKVFNTDDFATKAISIHGNKYDYSKFNYTNTKTKGIITCKIHGDFLQSANKHLGGRGCSKCSKKYIPNNNDFLNKAKEVHGDKFKYLTDYVGAHDKIKIKCNVCSNLFEQTPANHLHGNGKGCPYCAGKYITTKDFIKKSILVHGDKYDYSGVVYKKATEKVDIKCSECLSVFWQTPNNHLRGKGCPKCKSSKGEEKIKLFLENNKINYKPQKSFDECRNKQSLRYDFFLIDKNILIEYDGEQHFKQLKCWGGENGFKRIKINDDIKDNFAKDKNIALLRIPYTEFKNIEKILTEKLGIING